MPSITIGLDLAKNVFRVHGVDAEGTVTIKRRLRRGEVETFFRRLPPSLVGMEACASAHHGARTLAAQGHEVRLMPASYVKPYVRRNKTDAADAAAICEAVSRPSMRFVAIKTANQQAALMLHRTRDLLIRQRTMLINALRAHMAEVGIVAAQGRGNLQSLIKIIRDPADERLPAIARSALDAQVTQYMNLQEQIDEIEAAILAWHRSNAVSRRLATIPGIGPITASALAATVPDAEFFYSGRDLAAWLGLTPHQNSSGGKERSAGVSKRGDRYIRRLLVIGAMSVIRSNANAEANAPSWLGRLLDRRPKKVAALALANKMARIAWALMAHGETYRAATA
jgi:transposase